MNNYKRHIPNLLTALRVLACVPLALTEVMSLPFLCLYLFSGIVDMLDGWTARKLNAVSDFGARFDSFADIVLVFVSAYKFAPVIHLPVGVWIVICLVALIKVINAGSYKVVQGFVAFPHTIANKVTGFLVFAGILCVNLPSFSWIALFVSIVALIASVQEYYFIRVQEKKEEQMVFLRDNIFLN